MLPKDEVTRGVSGSHPTAQERGAIRVPSQLDNNSANPSRTHIIRVQWDEIPSEPEVYRYNHFDVLWSFSLIGDIQVAPLLTNSQPELRTRSVINQRGEGDNEIHIQHQITNSLRVRVEASTRRLIEALLNPSTLNFAQAFSLAFDAVFGNIIGIQFSISGRDIVRYQTHVRVEIYYLNRNFEIQDSNYRYTFTGRPRLFLRFRIRPDTNQIRDFQLRFLNFIREQGERVITVVRGQATQLVNRAVQAAPTIAFVAIATAIGVLISYVEARFIENIRDEGVRRGLCNQFASGYVRFILEPNNQQSWLIGVGRGTRTYAARVHGVQRAFNEVRSSNISQVRNALIWRN